MATTNKDLDQPALNSTNWDVPLNANFGVIDAAMGGNTSKSVTGVGTTPVVLTASEYQKLILTFSGTLTANVIYHIPSGVGGEWIVRNSATGSFTLTIGNAGGGTSAVVPQSAQRTVYSDGTNIRFSDDQTVSPALTGTPTAPTASVGTNTTQIATTAFVNAEIANDAPSKTGTGASGTWGIDISGNAATATSLSGLTATVTELNYTDGVTSAIQTQLDGKSGFGVGQSWQLVSRSSGVSYQNTTGKPIQVAMGANNSPLQFEASTNGSSWVFVGTTGTNVPSIFFAVIPNGHYYRATGGLSSAAELR